MMRLLFLLLFWWLFVEGLWAQSSDFFGKIKEAETNENVLFGTVELYQDGLLKSGTETDFDGNYVFRNVTAGIYVLQASYLGFQTKKVVDITVLPGKRIKVDIVLAKETHSGQVPAVVVYEPSEVADISENGGGLTAEQIRALPTRQINGWAPVDNDLYSEEQKEEPFPEEEVTIAPVEIRAYRVPLVDIDICFAGGGSEIGGNALNWFRWENVTPHSVVSNSTFSPLSLGSLSGFVSNTVNGEACSFTEITLKKNGAKIRSVTTDLQGEYHFIDLVPGRYELVVPRSKAARAATSVIEITGGVESDYNINIQALK
ncbi:carboxypeptidase regulatory-like domain-containing protein [Lewinella cohaerens]|uniref:carboxypeptidase regulatory-like domain-containing protein n=1 Tax=Lewinella cohaerens TaxID=70995 RepID=UPI0003708234|nr:carboxypeptidase regulatory-like domain-containing protein [Lewinella cohaerens]